MLRFPNHHNKTVLFLWFININVLLLVFQRNHRWRTFPWRDPDPTQWRRYRQFFFRNRAWNFFHLLYTLGKTCAVPLYLRLYQYKPENITKTLFYWEFVIWFAKQIYLKHCWFVVAGQLHDGETIALSVFHSSPATLRLVPRPMLLFRLFYYC